MGLPSDENGSHGHDLAGLGVEVARVGCKTRNQTSERMGQKE